MVDLISVGKKAPAFTLLDREGTPHSLSKMEASYFVLFFYPKDSTPGCTLESQEFSKDLPKFKRLNAQVIGISGGDEKSKAKFCSKYNLKTLMLSDSDFTVASKFGVYGPKKFMGKTYNGISRATFILDAKYKVIKVFDSVKPATHSVEVLDFLKSLNKK